MTDENRHPVYDELTLAEFWGVMALVFTYTVIGPTMVGLIAFTGDDPDSFAYKIRTHDPYGCVDPHSWSRR